jgi:ubiquinone/menaquinone biosynthesis C-methylase UbiE
MPTLARLTEHYDSKYKASDFTKVVPVPLLRSPQNRMQMCVYLAARNAGGHYLEIGAGDGSVLLALADKYERLVGTDLSRVRVKQMQLLFREDSKVTILNNNLEVDGLPFNAGEFDTAAMVDVIEHIVDPIGALKELHRVLKPQGRLIILTPNIAKWTRRLKLAAGYFPSTASLQEGLIHYDKKTPTDLHDEGHLHYFTYRSLCRLAVERAGFKRAETAGYGKSFVCKLWPEMFSDLCATLYK